MKELEDRAEQNRTGILLKAAQRATSCGDGNELVTLEQLQEVGLIVNINIIFLFLFCKLEYMYTIKNAVKISEMIFNFTI